MLKVKSKAERLIEFSRDPKLRRNKRDFVGSFWNLSDIRDSVISSITFDWALEVKVEGWVVNCRKEKEKSRRVTIVNESRRAPRRLVDWSCESARDQWCSWKVWVENGGIKECRRRWREVERRVEDCLTGGEKILESEDSSTNESFTFFPMRRVKYSLRLKGSRKDNSDLNLPIWGFSRIFHLQPQSSELLKDSWFDSSSPKYERNEECLDVLYLDSIHFPTSFNPPSPLSKAMYYVFHWVREMFNLNAS